MRRCSTSGLCDRTPTGGIISVNMGESKLGVRAAVGGVESLLTWSTGGDTAVADVEVGETLRKPL